MNNAFVKKNATKNEIYDAINTLYNEKCVKINTNRTIYGKKAFIKFETTEKARDLATKIGNHSHRRSPVNIKRTNEVISDSILLTSLI